MNDPFTFFLISVPFPVFVTLFSPSPPTRSSLTLSGHQNAEALSLLGADTELNAIFIPYWCRHSIRLFQSAAANGIQRDEG